jgi:hypothetical protein
LEEYNSQSKNAGGVILSNGVIAYRIPTGEDKQFLYSSDLVLFSQQPVLSDKGMHWMLSISPQEADIRPQNARLVFVLDKSASMGSSFKNMVMPGVCVLCLLFCVFVFVFVLCYCMFNFFA